jgi:hypothetical protein
MYTRPRFEEGFANTNGSARSKEKKYSNIVGLSFRFVQQVQRKYVFVVRQAIK